MKRRAALQALHELRSIVHVIDMHQLTKDPSLVVTVAGKTASSPQRVLSPFEVARYLDYCSEMVSLTSKVAVLFAQGFPDPVVTEVVSDIERVAAGLSQKIWQKIMILQSSQPCSPPCSGPSATSRSAATPAPTSPEGPDDHDHARSCRACPGADPLPQRHACGRRRADAARERAAAGRLHLPPADDDASRARPMWRISMRASARARRICALRGTRTWCRWAMKAGGRGRRSVPRSPTACSTAAAQPT